MSEKIIIAVVVGLTCSVVLIPIEIFIFNPIRERKAAVADFRATFSALLIVFDENSIKFPLPAQDFLADIYNVQLKAMTNAEATLWRESKKRALRNTWGEYYRYVTNNDFESWLDSNNRIDSNDTVTGSLKAETRDRIQALLDIF